MAITVTAEQVSNTAVDVSWVDDDTVTPAVSYAVTYLPNPPGVPQLGAIVGQTQTSVVIDVQEVQPATGDPVELKVERSADSVEGSTTITWLDMTAAAWTTIADVRTMLGAQESAYTDEEIQTAIATATARLESVFCKTVTVDDVTGLPTDQNVQTATTVMASRILVYPSTGVPPVQGGQITSERMGSYSYSIRPGTAPKSSGPQTIDGYLKELVGGYLCPGYAGIPTQTDIYPYEAPEELEASQGVTTGP